MVKRLIRSFAILTTVAFLFGCAIPLTPFDELVRSLDRPLKAQVLKVLECDPADPSSLYEFHRLLGQPEWQIVDYKELKGGKFRVVFIRSVPRWSRGR
jgi:hypothetical protein